MQQRWEDLLFAHWPCPADVLRRHVPEALTIDTFDGSAWFGVVPFRMSGVRLRWMPALPGAERFPELNVRTYVTLGGKPGVWFLSLDAGSPLAVSVARRWFHLPYYNAEMQVVAHGETVRYSSRRVHPGAPEATFDARYGPGGPVSLAAPGTLEHWLTERYCLYAAASANGRQIVRGEIHHAPWPLQPAHARVSHNTMAHVAGVALPDAVPLLHFARALDVRLWAPRKVAA